MLTRSVVCCTHHQDHDKLGKAGDIVDVKAGYARNTLFPRGVADYAVPSVIQDLRVSTHLGKFSQGCQQQQLSIKAYVLSQQLLCSV